ncbi:ribonuclease Z [archaeon]|mgnify:FL=1|jgi:ribonuclease Z|nr:ribonuclease Z [archaeon]MBT7128182.1 ribonuclease Z [archaeon]
MAERIELTFLGTGSAIPTKRRNHPAMLLKYKSENILIDCGEGTQKQFRKAGLNPCKITKILISHWHGDHTFGLPGILNTLRLNGYNGKLEIYGPKGSKEWVRKYLDLVGRRGIDLDLKVHEVKSGIIFDEGEYFVEAMEVDHDCPAVGYSFIIREKNRLDGDKLKKLKIPNSPLIGELVKGKVVTIDGKRVDGKKLLYKEAQRKVSFVMDTRYNSDIVKFVKGADLLVCESTFSKRESEELLGQRAHLSSVEAAGIAKKAKVKGLALVHLSQRYEGIPKVILGEAVDIFGKGVVVPEDLERVEL